MSYCKLRKARNCKGCGVEIKAGTMAYRSMLYATINDVMRCDRICPHCIVDHGTDLSYAK
jgi:hypothetical protein